MRNQDLSIFLGQKGRIAIALTRARKFKLAHTGQVSATNEHSLIFSIRRDQSADTVEREAKFKGERS